MIIWLAIPTVVVFFLARGYIVSFLVSGDPASASAIASILGVLALAILFRSVYQISSRSFYAQQDTKTPLYISIFTIGLNIVLAIVLALTLGLGFIGLAMAQTIAAFVEVVILFSIMQYRIRGLFTMKLARAVCKMFFAAAITFVFTYIATQLVPLQATDTSIFVTLPKFLVICLVAGVTYLIASRYFGLREVNPIIARINKIIFSQFKPPRTN